MRLKVVRPFKDLGAWKRPGDYITAEGWRASKLLQSGNVQTCRETATVRPPERAVIPEPAPREIEQKSIPIMHVGGGVYELPNGQRIRGKEAAYEAMEEGE